MGDGSSSRHNGIGTLPRRAAYWISGALLAVFVVLLSRLRQLDFEVYRMGSQHVFGTGLYSSNITYMGRHLLFTYTPVAALALSPFSHLSISTGQLIWSSLNVVALITLVAVSVAAAQGRAMSCSDWRLGFIAATPIVLLVLPVRYGLELGQINIVLVLMVVTDLTMPVSLGRTRMPRGVLVGMAAAFKLTPLIFVPFLLATRQWRVARTAVVTFVAATGVLAVLAPGASWRYFTHDEFDVGRVGNSNITDNQTFNAALARAGFAHDHVVVDLLLVIVLAVGIALAAVAYQRSSALLGILVCAATGLMVSPISWIHHFVWCVPLFVWLAMGVDRPRRWREWIAAVAVVLIVTPPAQTRAGDAVLYVRENAYVVATLGFIVLVGLMLSRRGAHTAQAQSRGMAVRGTMVERSVWRGGP